MQKNQSQAPLLPQYVTTDFAINSSQSQINAFYRHFLNPDIKFFLHFSHTIISLYRGLIDNEAIFPVYFKTLWYIRAVNTENSQSLRNRPGPCLNCSYEGLTREMSAPYTAYDDDHKNSTLIWSCCT